MVTTKPACSAELSWPRTGQQALLLGRVRIAPLMLSCERTTQLQTNQQLAKPMKRDLVVHLRLRRKLLGNRSCIKAQLRKPALPSSTPVERLWNVFGDNLTSKRRCMSRGMLANLVYARMNMHMLPNDWLPFDTQDVGSLFKSLFDSAEELDDQAEVDVVVAARRALGDLGREETSEDDAAVADAGAADEAEPNWLD